MPLKKKYYKGLSLVSSNYNFKNLTVLLKQKFAKFNLIKLNDFIQNLYTYKNIFTTITPTALIKNGFTENHLRLYKPVLENTIIQAVSKKSDLLNAEQLPGQVALFGLGKSFDDARSNGSYKQENIIYNRQESINNTNKTEGKETDIFFALNKIIKGKYTIIDISLLQPSHIGSIQNPLHFIPEAQPRNRSTSASGYNTPKLIAENLRPAEIVEGATAFTGAPIVNKRGEVIQGNGRAYTIKYYYSNFPNDPANYKKWIKENLTCLGFDLKTILPTQPVVVRMVTCTDAEAIELGQFTQKDLEAVANETTQIKSKVGLISDAALDTILNNLLAKDTGEQSLSELIRDSEVLKVLIKENIIRGDDLEVYTRNGVINETGVNFITKLLLNLIFKDADVNTPDVFLQLPVSLQKAVEKSALYVLKCRGEQNINTEVSKAILGLREYLAFKPNGSIKEWAKQTDIFNNTIENKYTPLEIKLISIFADGGSQKLIVDIFKNYAFWATLEPGNMFDDERPALSKKEAVKKVFNLYIMETTNLKLKAIAIAKAKAQALLLIETPANLVKKTKTKTTEPKTIADQIKTGIKQTKAADLKSKITHEVTLYSDAKASQDRFAITDRDGNVLWYGKFFDNDTDYNGEQSSGELAAAKKAVWLANKIKEAWSFKALRLNLFIDAQWLLYQNHSGQKGYALTQLCNKYNIELNIDWISGKDNPADKWTVSSGFKKWSDNNLKNLATEIIEETERKILSSNDAMNNDIAAENEGKTPLYGLGAICENMSEKDRLIAKKEALQKTKQYKLGVFSFPSNMPNDLIKIIKSWIIISKSPYSESYYNTACKSWDITPEKSYRVSDHWNFYSKGKIHCKTDKDLSAHNGWALAQYLDGLYKVISLFEFDTKKQTQHSDIRDKEDAILRKKLLAKIGFDLTKKQTLPPLYETKKMYYNWVNLQEWKLCGFDKKPKPSEAKAVLLRYKPKIKLTKGVYKGSGRNTKRVGSKELIGRLIDFVRKDVAVVKTIAGEVESSKEFDFITGFVKFENQEFNKWRKIYGAM